MTNTNKKFSVSAIGNYLKESKSELKKIVWASPKQITNNSILVIVAILVCGAAVSLVDFLLLSGIQGIIGLLGK
jgi:preprotein translocase subunit SecE